MCHVCGSSRADMPCSACYLWNISCDPQQAQSPPHHTVSCHWDSAHIVPSTSNVFSLFSPWQIPILPSSFSSSLPSFFHLKYIYRAPWCASMVLGVSRFSSNMSCILGGLLRSSHFRNKCSLLWAPRTLNIPLLVPLPTRLWALQEWGCPSFISLSPGTVFVLRKGLTGWPTVWWHEWMAVQH